MTIGGAFTLEAQHFPNSPNHSSFPSTELTARLKYYPTTVYKFLLLLPQLRKLRWRRSVLG
jgi:hypothetical protein